MICKQLKIKCKIILLKMLENGLNKSYFMTYQAPHWKKRQTKKYDLYKGNLIYNMRNFLWGTTGLKLLWEVSFLI